MSINAGNLPQTPDFAFPVKVEGDADKSMRENLKKGDDAAALKDAVQLIVARNLVSADSFSRNVALLDSLSGELHAPYSQLSTLLEASLYNQLYQSSAWQFNSRKLPLDTYPENPMEWSGDLFAKKILSLVDKALENKETSISTPIGKITPLLRNYEYAVKSNLSVYDFMVTMGSNLLENFGSSRSGSVIPFFKETIPAPADIRQECYSRRIEVIDSLYSMYMDSDNVAAKVWAVSLKANSMPYEKRASFLKEWIGRLEEHPESGMLLNSYYTLSANNTEDENGDKGKSKKDLYAQLQNYVKRFPDSTFTPSIKYDIARMAMKKVSLELPSAALSSHEVKGTLKSSNVNKAYVLLYRVPENIVNFNSLNLKEFPRKATFIKAISVDAEGIVPFESKSDFTLPGMSPGFYVAVPSLTPKLSSNWKNEVDKWSISVINISDITIVTSRNTRDKGSGRIFVVNASTQQPIAGARVSFYPDNSDNLKTPSQTLTSDNEGCIKIPEKAGRRIRVSDGKSILWTAIDNGYYIERDENSRHGSIYTDLSVYKPGETVRFSVVAWTSKGHDNQLLANQPLKIIFRDANWQQVDTATFVTDRFGRLAGSFKVPEQGLLGRYSLAVCEPGNNRGDFASQGFQVAEYKAPTFFVSLDSDKDMTFLPGDSLRFNGEVKTFSGMSLGGMEVDYDITWHQWWRWQSYGIDNASYSGKTSVNPDGKFTIELPTANLQGTPFERGIFRLTVTATSPAGETQTSSPLMFSLGDDFSLRPEIEGKVKVTGNELIFNVPVYDILGNPTVKEVDYAIFDQAKEKTVLKGSFNSPRLEIQASSLPSGSYKFSFSLPGNSESYDTDVVIWREDDKRPPVEQPLWVPENEVIVPEGAKSVPVKVGSPYPDSWILCQISDEDRILEYRWVRSDGENVSVNIDAPAGNARRWVSFSGMHDYVGATATVTLTPEAATRKMEVKTLSFRDKISAGDQEKWVFSFRLADKVQPGIPAMAVMSNKALDAIAPFSWNFSIGGNSWYNSSRLRAESRNMHLTSAGFSKLPSFKIPDTSMPDWDTYGQMLAGGRIFIRGTRMMKMAANGYAAVKEEAEMEDAVFVSAEPQMAMNDMVMESKAASFDLEEPAVATAGEGGNDAASSVKVEPRPVEMPSAFFKPMLTGDPEGNVNVEFVTPDFNTTWKFQLMGYDEELHSVGVRLEAVASKPVMVQVNPPRYLRTGDKAYVSAMLFNNSPEKTQLHGEIIIFNPLNGETITSMHLGAEETAPGANRTMTIDYNVPSGITAVGVRAYAYAGEHADGEQVLVPVLPSSTPVVESAQFYLGQGEGIFKQKLPKYRKDASLTLKYCANPVWECVLALPSIATPESNSVLSLSRALYANGLARHIMVSQPAVREGLDRLFSVGKEKRGGVLTSNLSKDSLLKTVALANTPWVNSAAAETMRLENLSQLLDSRRLDEAVKGVGDKLSARQNGDGGWSWCEGMRSSVFITRSVLGDLAALKKYGALDNAEGMIKRGVAYCDKEYYDSYEKNDRKFSTVEMLRYLYIRSFLEPGEGKSGFSTLRKEALKAIEKEWRDLSIFDKATAAILLNRTPGYEKTSRLILESLRQLASKDEAKGWWYDNLQGGWSAMPKLATTARALEAFADVEPASPAVDGLRQWLVLQKETEDWGSNNATVGVVNAILSSGSDWLADVSVPVVRLNGKPIDLGDAEMLTGLATVSLSPAEASGKTLTVEKSSQAPVWGGVISQYIAPVMDVKAEKCENIQVRKQLLLITSLEDGTEAIEDIGINGKKSLKPGDKVRVTITITCSKDMDYVALIDDRSACLEPVDQLSGFRVVDGLGSYREIRDTKTSFFIDYLPKGVNVISYDCYVDREGEYALGITSVQSQYSPLQSAHSAGGKITVRK